MEGNYEEDEEEKKAKEELFNMNADFKDLKEIYNKDKEKGGAKLKDATNLKTL
jgi:hypothetical protein